MAHGTRYTIERRMLSAWRFSLRVLLCYVIALQAALSAFAAAPTTAHASTVDGWVICHDPSGDAAPDGHLPGGERAHCALCVLCAPASALLPDPVAAAHVFRVPIAVLGVDRFATIDSWPPPRAGLSRAPPGLA